MTDRRYTLYEITGAMGEALKDLSLADRSMGERAILTWSDNVIDRLKAIADAPPVDGDAEDALPPSAE